MNKLLKTATITASALAIGLAFAASAVAAPKHDRGHQSAGQHGSSHNAGSGHRGTSHGIASRHTSRNGHGNSHGSSRHFTSRHGGSRGHGGHNVGAVLAYAVGFGIVNSIVYSNSYAHNAGYQTSYGGSCHTVTKLGYDAYGRRARIGGTMCYDSYGQSYIVAGSRYVIDYY